MKKLLEELASTTERGVKTREELFAKVKTELKLHATIEEESLYPALKEHPKAKEVVLEGYEEHHVADTILGELDGVPVDDERWGAKLSVLKENIEHHIEEEEEDMFEKARDIFDDDELEAMGERMQARKKTAEAELVS